MSRSSLAVRILLIGMLLTAFGTMPRETEAAPAGFRLPFSGFAYISQGPRCTISHWNYPDREAIDFALPEGHRVLASAGGMAQSINNDPVGGNMVKIYHSNGYVSVYAHLRDFGGLNYSGWVNQGQWIGSVGRTGRAQGAHLHFHVLQNGNMVRIHDLPGITWYSSYYPANPNSTCPIGGYDGHANG